VLSPSQAVSSLSIGEDCRLLSTALCLDADSLMDVDRQMLVMLIYRSHMPSYAQPSPTPFCIRQLWNWRCLSSTPRPLRKQNCHDDPCNLGMLWHDDAAAWSDVGIWAHVPWPTSCSMPLDLMAICAILRYMAICNSETDLRRGAKVQQHNPDSGAKTNRANQRDGLS